MRKQPSSDSKNQTTWLILEGFEELQHLGFLPFTLFLVVYVVTVGGNNLVMLAVASSRTLHTPMYFFLGHFSLLEMGCTSNIVPQLLQSFLDARETISLVTVWSSSTPPLPLCPGSREFDHYFCEFAPVVGLFYGDVGVMWGAGASISGFLTLAPLLWIVASYAFILSAALRIPSSYGKQKAFSTCSSHLRAWRSSLRAAVTVFKLAPRGALPLFFISLKVAMAVWLSPIPTPCDKASGASSWWSLPSFSVSELADCHHSQSPQSPEISPRRKGSGEIRGIKSAANSCLVLMPKRVKRRNKIGAELALHQKNTNHYVDFWEL
eukprot:bmy_05808T0